MSEKRRQKQQRRERRKAKRATRAANSADRLLAQAARLATASIAEITTGLEAELWASSLLGDWRARALPDEDLLPDLVQAFEAIGTAPALASLRALSAIGAPAGEAADRLAKSGLPEPEWVTDLGRTRATAAAILEERVFEDAVTVYVEFDGADVIGFGIDHNLGGLLTDVFLTGPLAQLRGDPAMRDIGLDEARARVEAALDVLDDAPASPLEDVWEARAMVDARLRLLPDGFVLPTVVEPVDRDALLADFLASLEGDGFDSPDIARLAIDFGVEDNYGGPLRWSPSVVEHFMTDWLPSMVIETPEFFARVPDALSAWVRYAGQRRGVPEAAWREAVTAVAEYHESMLNAATDPDAWDLANALAEAALEAGVDPTDDAALARFMRDRAP